MQYTAVVQFRVLGVKLQLASCHRHVQIPYWLVFQALCCLYGGLPHFALLICFLGLYSSACTCRGGYPNIKPVLTRAGYVIKSRVQNSFRLSDASCGSPTGTAKLLLYFNKLSSALINPENWPGLQSKIVYP